MTAQPPSWYVFLEDGNRPTGQKACGGSFRHGTLAQVLRYAAEQIELPGESAFVHDRSKPDMPLVAILDVDESRNLSITVRRQSPQPVIGRERRWIRVSTSQVLEGVY